MSLSSLVQLQSSRFKSLVDNKLQQKLHLFKGMFITMYFSRRQLRQWHIEIPHVSIKAGQHTIPLCDIVDMHHSLLPNSLKAFIHFVEFYFLCTLKQKVPLVHF